MLPNASVILMMFIVQTLLANVTHDPHLHSYVYVDSPLIVSIKFYSLIYVNIKFYILIYPTLSLLCKILYCEHTHWPLISLTLNFTVTLTFFLPHGSIIFSINLFPIKNQYMVYKEDSLLISQAPPPPPMISRLRPATFVPPNTAEPSMTAAPQQQSLPSSSHVSK